MDGINEELMAEINAAIDSIEQEENTQLQENQLQENSEELLVKLNTVRFNDAEWFEEMQRSYVTIAGCGGIGSWTALLISRLTPYRIQLFDNDIVEEVNLAGQLFSTDNIGDFKIYSCIDVLNKFSNFFRVYGSNYRLTLNTTASADTLKNIICGFDNMASRKDVFEAWYFLNKGDAKSIFIDGRLNAEDFQIFCITGENAAAASKYKEQYLFNDAEVEEAPCSYKQTSFCASMIASLITNLFVNHIANMVSGDFRCLPFKISYDATTMLLKTEV
nr:MAG TPA: ThiF family [Crassvirales sp.]